MNIAFCCDKVALPGLYVSLASLLKMHPEQMLRVFIFQEGMSERDCAGLRKTASTHPGAEVTILPFSTASLTNLKGLHGNYMTYARLFLADLLPDLSRLIYLDSDLQINCSLLPLWEADLSPFMLGAISTSTIEWSLENRLLTSLGLALDDPYFNAGVLLIDLAGWREEGMTPRCLAFLREHREQCKAADQTVLNAFFSTAHRRLPPHFNLLILPSVIVHADQLPDGVLHFVGSPKPWDFAGEIVHGSGRIFGRFLRETAFGEYSQADSGGTWRRTLLLSKAYYRTIKWRLLKMHSEL